MINNNTLSNTHHHPVVFPMICAFLAFLFFSSMDAIVRYLGSWYNAITLGLYQRIFSVLLLLVYMMIRSVIHRNWNIFRLNYLHSHILRGVMLFFISLSFNSAFIQLPLNTAYSMIFFLPIFTVIVGIIFLNEHVSRLRLAAIILGFIGILIILRPGFQKISAGYLYALIGIMIEAPMLAMIRHYHKHDNSFTVSFYPAVVSLCIFVVYDMFLANGVHHNLPLKHLFFLALFGAFSVSSQVTLAYSLRYIKVGVSVAMQYTQIIWGTVFGYLIFKENSFTLFYVIGTVIILFSSYVATTNHLPFVTNKKSNCVS